MNNIKRAVCFVTAAAVTAASTCVFAQYQYIDPIEYMDSIYAYDMEGFDIADAEEQEAVSAEEKQRFEYLYRLGVWDDTEKKPQEFVTEKEFNVIYGRAVLGSENVFDKAYLKEADGDFVSYKTVYKRFIETLGYSHKYAGNDTNQAILSVAKELGIVPQGEETLDIDGFVTRKSFAEIVEKALLTDLCEKVYYTSGYSYNVLEGQTLLNSVHNVYRFEGIVNAMNGIAIYGNPVDREDEFQIDGQSISDNGMEVAEYFGKWVVGYARYSKATGRYLLVSVNETDGAESYELDFEDIASLNNTVIQYENAQNKIKRLNVSSVDNILVNGSKRATLSECKDCIAKDGKIIITASKKNGALDCAVLWVYDYYVVSYNSLGQKRIGLDQNLKYNGNSYIEIDEDAVCDVCVNGKAATVEEIPSGASVCVALSDDGRYIKIYAEQSKIEGSVSKTGKDFVIINDEKYSVSATLTAYMELCRNDASIDANDVIKPFSSGTMGVFYIYGDKIVGYKASNVYSYAYLSAVANVGDGFNDEIKIKLFTSDGEWKIYELADTLEFDGIKKKKQEVYAAINADAQMVNEVVRYKVNVKDFVVGLDTINDTPYEADDAYSVRFEEKWKGGMSWTYEYLEDSKFWLDDKTVIFAVPTNLNDEDEYKIVHNTELPYDSEKSPEIKLNLYSANDFNVARAAVWEGGKAAAGDISFFMHIENIGVTLNEKDETEYVLIGQEYKNLRVRAKGICQPTEVMITEEMFDANGVKVGQFLGAAVVDGYVEAVKIYSDDGSVPATDEILNVKSYVNVVVGTIKKIDYSNNYVLVEYRDESGAMQEFRTIPRAKGIINTARNKTTNAELSDFAAGDRVMLYDNIGQGSWIFKNE